MNRPLMETHSISGGSPLRDVATWQPDSEASECYICHSQFTFLHRKHHCRRCGKIVCSGCSLSKVPYLPSSYVVTPPSQIFLESPLVAHRTCDKCTEELAIIRNTIDAAEDSSNSQRRNSQVFKNNAEPQRSRNQASDPIEVQSESDYGLCPICAQSVLPLSEQDREAHIEGCIAKAEFNGSPEQYRKNNRMLVYNMPEKSANGMSECVICLEDMEPGDKVGRLECLCVFHYKCIKDWFERKGPGECPVHAVHL